MIIFYFFPYCQSLEQSQKKSSSGEFFRISAAGLAIIIPAAIFMVFHLAPERMLHTFVGGLLFGYFCYYTGNIYTCIIMHVMTNFMWATFLNSYLLGFISLKTGILAAAGAMTVIGLLMIICLKIIFDRRFVKR